jgi:putative flippase GtrA
MLHALYRARTARFAVVGLTVTALHLMVFQLVLPWSAPEVANVVGFVVATQVNFVLSYFWTWSSRRPVGQETVRRLLRRVALFNGSAALAFGANAAVFSVAYRIAGVSPVGSALMATAGSAVMSFVLSSRVVFTLPPVLDAGAQPRVPAGAVAPRLLAE